MKENITEIVVIYILSMKGPILGFISFEWLRIHKKGFLKISQYVGRFVITLTFMTFSISLIKHFQTEYIFEISFILSGFTFYILDKIDLVGQRYIKELNYKTIKKIIKFKINKW